MLALMRLLDQISSGSEVKMDESRKKPDREYWERDAEVKRLLAERIAYHERKLAEEKAEREKRDELGAQ